MSQSQDSLHLLFAQHRRFLARAVVFVAKDMGESKTASYRKLLLLLTRRLNVHISWLLRIEEYHLGKEGRRQSQLSDLTPPAWGPIVVTRRSYVTEDGGCGTVLQIDGPADGDTHTAAMDSEQAAYAVEADIEQYSAMACLLVTLHPMFFLNYTDSKNRHPQSKTLARATEQAMYTCDLPARSISTQPLHPTHGAVSDSAAADAARIALLKEYNDLRDTAQQLIGIIADNRGVPVRSLYTDRSFGVGIDD